MRGVYDATAMSSHFPDFLDDDTFGLDSYEVDHSCPLNDILATADTVPTCAALRYRTPPSRVFQPEALVTHHSRTRSRFVWVTCCFASESTRFNHIGLQQYADAQYMPDVSSVTQISAPGYASAGYISAVQSMPSLDDLVGSAEPLFSTP